MTAAVGELVPEIARTAISEAWPMQSVIRWAGIPADAESEAYVRGSCKRNSPRQDGRPTATTFGW